MDIKHSFGVILIIFHICFLCFAYKTYKLEDYELCASKKIFKPIIDFINRGPEIELENGKNSAAHITQTWNSSDYMRKMKSNCSFRIKNKRSKGGIYIVLTKLKFRKDPITNSCIDYIEFWQPKLPRNTSNRTCERFGSYDTTTQLLFNNRSNEVHITVSIDKTIKITEPLEIDFVATAHHECNSSPSARDNEFQCDPNRRDSCISEYFVNDGIKNCMPPCRDESDCSLESISVEIMDASNVALSAITSLIFTMIGVGTCLWLCWKYKDCTSINQREENSTEQRQNENGQNVEISEGNQTTNSEIQRPPSPKEDLPPSYESLFPDR